MTTQRETAALSRKLSPNITLIAEDFERLSVLAQDAADRLPDVSAILAGELERAHVLADVRPDDVVCMGSEVEFRDEVAGKAQLVTLVYPGEADIAQGKISVLTPIGAALIGVRVGDSISWETRSGAMRRLTVLKVRTPQFA